MYKPRRTKLKALNKLMGIAAVAVFAAGCSDSSSTPEGCGECYTVITGVASDYGSSHLTLASGSSYEYTEGYAAQDLSDIGSAIYDGSFYRLGRSSQDNLTKYSVDNPNLVEWQFSVETDANPYDIVFASPQKAYVIRYGASSIWVVDPSVSASEEEFFKLAEIDLSAYDPDTVPNMSAAKIVDGKLFVAMQALDASWVPGQAYLAVIDTATDTEIDVDGNPANGYALPLTIKNPIDIDVQGSSIYVTGVGRYYPQEFTGGIEKVNATTYDSTLLVDDGGDLGQIPRIAIVSDTLGYLVDYASWQNTSLRRFNPSTGEVSDTVVTGFSGIDIASLAVSAYDELWVGIGDAEAPEIRVLDTNDDSLIETLELTMNPTQIHFMD